LAARSGRRWRNVNLFADKVAVVESAEQTATGVRYKPPKSGRGRTVALSATVVEELRVRRLQQSEELLRLGTRQLDATVVYAREDGEPMQPRSLTHAWQQILSRTTLPRFLFYNLRHAHATHLLSNGVHPKVASEPLDHSRVGITLDLYSHVLPGMQENAAARIDEVLRQALQKRSSANVR
jgi:integrase